jgi:hypothetical protein
MNNELSQEQRDRLTAARILTPSRDASGFRPTPTYAERAMLCVVAVVILAVWARW